MPDLVEFTSDDLSALLIAVSGLGVLLLAGVSLRAVVPLFRRFFIPAALIGGVLGLALGPYAAGLIPDTVNNTWASLAGLLITIVFAPMLLGERLPSLKTAAKEAAPHVFYSYFSSFAVIAVPALLTFFIFQPAFGTNALFSTIVEVSWPGGHGTAAGMDESYTALGWGDGSSLALGAATVGLIFGILVGMTMLNIAARRGLLVNYKPGNNGSASDIVDVAESRVESRSRLRKTSLDNLAFHFALIAVAILIGYGLKYLVDQLITGVPLFPLAMIGGLIIQVILVRTPIYQLVDKATLNAIVGIALDFLIVAAVASVSIPIVLDNWIPLVVTMAIAAAMSVGIFYYVGPRIFREHWVENSIVNFGSMTGVASVGLMLLRAADPDLKTNAFRGYALRAPFASPFVGGGLITALFPILAVQYGNLWLGLGCLVVCVVLVVLAKATGMWKKPLRQTKVLQADH